MGLAGLYEGRRTGRPPKWPASRQQELRALANAEGGSARSLLNKIQQVMEVPQISIDTLKRYLRKLKFSYKRARYSLRGKRNQSVFEHVREVITLLGKLDHEGQCELIYFDESGFSPNPPLQYSWSPIGQTRQVEPQSHRQRVNILGALHHCGKLIWATLRRSTKREDVIAFFDALADRPHSVPRIVVLDNAAIHKGEVMEKKRKEWAKKGLYLFYLPPYSPELNRIEILWRQAKYFWRRLISLNGAKLYDEIQSLMQGFGTEFTINFA